MLVDAENFLNDQHRRKRAPFRRHRPIARNIAFAGRNPDFALREPGGVCDDCRCPCRPHGQCKPGCQRRNEKPSSGESSRPRRTRELSARWMHPVHTLLRHEHVAGRSYFLKISRGSVMFPMETATCSQPLMPNSFNLVCMVVVSGSTSTILYSKRLGSCALGATGFTSHR